MTPNDHIPATPAPMPPNGDMTYWRCYTHDWRPPLQGGDPVSDGRLPVTLPPVILDTSDAACAAGYHACAEPADALRIAGLWRNGRPSRLVACSLGADAITRGAKSRASTLTLHREATPAEWRAALLALHAPFGAEAAALTDEVQAWRAALAARGLTEWTVRRYASAGDAWAAWAAGAALLLWTAVRCYGLAGYDAAHLTTGLRDAYACGLACALPTGARTLGYAMIEEDAHGHA